MTLSSILTAFVAILCLAFASGQQAGTNCPDPRIRRSWDSYNATEKALYLEAVAIAMDKGFHMKFIQMHTDTVSGAEAHQNCMFIYWHRMMLLGYENMLRSLGTKYQCLTIPYWDHLAASARLATKNCTDLQSCTPYLANSGGTSSGSSKSLAIYSSTIGTSSTTLCVNQEPLSHFCGNNSVCAQCVTRRRSSSMSATAYPGEAAFGLVYNQMFDYNVYSSFSNNVERGVHNTIHNALGGVMAYLEAPADPIFYSHHGLVDLLQAIYLKCQVGAPNVFLSASDKSSDSRWYSICRRKNNGAMYTTADNITMRVLAFDGKTYVNVWQNPNNILYPFFKDLPYKYTDYIDAKDLGNYSYTYAISGGLANLYQNCRNASTISSTVNATTTSFMASTPDDVGYSRYGHRLEPVIEPGTAYDDKVKRWNVALYESARIVGYGEAAAGEQMEMVGCQYQEDCLGGVDDYSELYKKNFGIEGHTRCYTILEGLKSGDLVIGIPQWKSITARFLPCAAYKKKNVVTSFANAISELQNGKTLNDYVKIARD
ncbi:hypothetical protein DVH05_004589 [Phytophthora capsici]|nr:hypothetical protein DVH05_004589 [Phytophthora capsici]